MDNIAFDIPDVTEKYRPETDAFVPQVESERNMGLAGRIGAYAVRMGIVPAEFVTGGLVGSNGSKGPSYIGGFSGADNLHFVGGVRIKGEAKGAVGV